MELQKLLNHSVVTDIILAGVQPTITTKGLIIDGFYKSGTVLLYIDGTNKLVAKARYDEITEINTLIDLVELNLDWLERTASRNHFYPALEEPWKSLALRFNLVIEKTEVVTTFFRR